MIFFNYICIQVINFANGRDMTEKFSSLFQLLRFESCCNCIPILYMVTTILCSTPVRLNNTLVYNSFVQSAWIVSVYFDVTNGGQNDCLSGNLGLEPIVMHNNQYF